MQNALVYILLIISLGCTPIDKLEPNQTGTFLKFYSETNKMTSKDLAVLDDGYLIMSTYTDTTTLLLKTDRQGNKLWATSFNYFLGNSLAVIVDGYILIGDRINNQSNPVSTFMHLIKTDLEGNVSNTAELGNGVGHGAAITQTSDGDIIALGFITPLGGESYITTRGYKSNLDSSWTAQRDFLVSGTDQYPSSSLYELDNSNIGWLSNSIIDGINTSLYFSNIIPDQTTPGPSPRLFTNFTLSDKEGYFVKTPDGGFSIAQTVIVGDEKKIGYSSVNSSVSSETYITRAGNCIVGSIVNSTNGLLIAATTDYHNETARTDRDLLLIETNYNGTLKTDGINATFGGIGDEIPIRIRRTNDGGFAVLGTLTNSKGAKQSFLLKTDSKGKLN